MPDNHNLDEVKRLMRAAAREGLERAAAEVLVLMEPEMPIGDPAVDPNQAIELRESIDVEWDGSGVVISVNTRYAARQHEQSTLDHPRGGKWKYLEHPVQVVAGQLEGLIAGEVGKIFAGTQHGRRLARF